MIESIPYTYLLTFKKTGQYYYGCRYANGCHPDDLFKTYFTSSKIVKKLIKIYGVESFDYQIRKTFDNKKSCIYWEQKFLRKVRVLKNDKFLNVDYNMNASNAIQNKHSTIAISNPETNRCIRIIKPQGDIILPRGWVRGNINNYKPNTKKFFWMYNPITDEEILSNEEMPDPWVRGRSKKIKNKLSLGKQHMKKITNGTITKFIKEDGYLPEGWYYGDSNNKGSSGNMWITNGSVSKYIKTNEIIPNGWKKGRIIKLKNPSLS